MKFHPVAAIFPMMLESEFQELKEDILKNGLIEPIWTYQNKIVDGRNRYLACKKLGIKPRFKKWANNNGSTLVDFVISLNLKRRHLNASQKAMSAVDALPFFEKEAIESDIKIADGTLWPIPTIKHVPVSKENLEILTELSKHCAEPEVAIHFHVYSGKNVLFVWHDAFDNPIYLSDLFSEEEVKAFCDELSISYEKLY